MKFLQYLLECVIQSSLPGMNFQIHQKTRNILGVLTGKERYIISLLSLIVYIQGKMCFLLFWKSFVIQQVLSHDNNHLPLGVKSIK